MLNKALLQGRLTADPELRHTASNIAVTTFSLAVNRSYVRQGQERETDFINCVAWRSTAEFVCKYFKKGQQAVVDGSIQTRSYTDKDGNKRTAFEVVVDNIYFADSKGSSQSSASVPSTASFEVPSNLSFSNGDSQDFQVVDDDDLPF